MATLDEKLQQFKALFGSQADKVLKQAADKEALGDALGLTSKEFVDEDEVETLKDDELEEDEVGVDEDLNEEELAALDEDTQEFAEALAGAIDERVAEILLDVLPEALEEQAKEFAGELYALKQANEHLMAAVKELTGEQPAGYKQFRASQSEKTVKGKTTEKEGPQADPVASFVSEMFAAQNPNWPVRQG